MTFPNDNAIVAEYILAKFKHTLQEKDKFNLPFPPHWDPFLLYECNLVALVLAKAFRNPKSICWDVDDYISNLTVRCSGQNVNFEADLLRRFPPDMIPYQITEPCVITDINGKCLFWYLPGILDIGQSKRTLLDLKVLEKALSIDSKSKSWRASPTYFEEVDGGLKAGVVSLSPTWFQQGHEASNSAEVSRSLMMPSAMSWLKTNGTISQLVGGVLNVIQPILYHVGCAALRMISREPRLVHKGEQLPTILPHWKSPFSVISIISNRQTPLHWDNGALHSWPDILVAVGDYKGGVFELPGLGMKFRYDPGTMVGIAGRVLQHSAKCPGNRVCLAYYMRERLYEYLDLPAPGWIKLEDLL